jgi:FKBP-type peptidyl-prolyl cis-trans isomerase FkpA
MTLSSHRLLRSALVPTVLFGLLFGACAGQEEEAPNPDTAVTEQPLDTTTMTRSPEGIYYRVLEEGTGAGAADGQRATVHYTGWLMNGEQFDSSRGGRPFYFTIGRGDVIRGWDIGLVGMKVGERRQMVVPPELGYGEADTGVIPPNSPLVFTIELISLD